MKTGRTPWAFPTNIKKVIGQREEHMKNGSETLANVRKTVGNLRKTILGKPLRNSMRDIYKHIRDIMENISENRMKTRGSHGNNTSSAQFYENNRKT